MSYTFKDDIWHQSESYCGLASSREDVSFEKDESLSRKSLLWDDSVLWDDSLPTRTHGSLLWDDSFFRDETIDFESSHKRDFLERDSSFSKETSPREDVSFSRRDYIDFWTESAPADSRGLPPWWKFSPCCPDENSRTAAMIEILALLPWQKFSKESLFETLSKRADWTQNSKTKKKVAGRLACQKWIVLEFMALLIKHRAFCADKDGSFKRRNLTC